MLNFIPALILLIAQGCSPAEGRADLAVRALLAARSGAWSGLAQVPPAEGALAGDTLPPSPSRGLEMWRLVLLAAFVEPFPPEPGLPEPAGAAETTPSPIRPPEPPASRPSDGFESCGRTRDGPAF